MISKNTSVKPMTINALVLVFAFLTFSPQLAAQPVNMGENTIIYNRIIYTGQIVDAETGEPLPSARINSIFKRNDSTFVKMYLVDKEGKFRFEAPRTFNSRMEVVYVGYKLFEQPLPQDRQNEINLGKLRIVRDIHKIDEVLVQARNSLFTMEGDTVVVFPAVVKTMEGDALVDLLRRHPLFKVDDIGNVWMNGKRIERVNINGKLLFGEDVPTGVKVIAAKDVSLIKVYDEVDEKDEIMSGTKNARKRSVMKVFTLRDFDTITAADFAIEGGADKNKNVDGERELRYYANGNLGRYNDKIRIQVGGTVDNRPFNNIAGGYTPSNTYKRTMRANAKYENSSSDLLNGFSIGYTHSNQFLKDASSSQMVYSPTQYFDSRTSSNHSLSSGSQNTHKVELSYKKTKQREYGISGHYYFSFDNDIPRTLSTSNTFIDGEMTSYHVQNSKRNGNKYENHINLQTMKTLGDSGAIELIIGGLVSKSDGKQIRRDTINSLGIANMDILKISSNMPKYDFNAALHYAIRSDLSRIKNILQLRYQKEQSYVLAIDDFTAKIDTTLSGNLYLNTLQIEDRVSYFRQINNLQLTVGVNFSAIKANYDEMFPASMSIDKWDTSIMPEININYTKITSKGPLNCRLAFSGFHSSAPLIFLSDRLNDTNPMSLTAGNPDLKSSTQYLTDLAINFFGVSFSFTDRWIRNEPIFYRRYFEANTILPEYNDYEALAGSTLTTRINGNYYHDLNFKINYSKRVPLFMLGAEIGYTSRDPEVGFDDIIFRSHDRRVNAGLRIQSNFSTVIRMDINNSTIYQWYSKGDNVIDRSLRNQLTTTLRWDISDRVTFKSVYLYDRYNSPTSLISFNDHIMNASISCRVFKDRKGTIAFNAYDILNKSSNISVTVNDMYVHRILKQLNTNYFTISFEYKFH